MKKLKIVFAGTPQFAESYLSALINSKHDVNAVFTQPSKRSGRGHRQSKPSPRKQYPPYATRRIPDHPQSINIKIYLYNI